MLPQSGGYAQKTTLVGIRVSDDEDPQGIHYYSRADLAPRKRPPKKGGRAHPHHCFLILAGVPAGGARQLIGCTGSVYFRVAGDANSLTPNDQDAHPSGSRDLRATMTNGCFI